MAQFPHELITYGGNGSVFSNWAQYHLVMKYLSQMTDEQTLVMYSGHPVRSPTRPRAPCVPRLSVVSGVCCGWCLLCLSVNFVCCQLCLSVVYFCCCRMFTNFDRLVTMAARPGWTHGSQSHSDPPPLAIVCHPKT